MTKALFILTACVESRYLTKSEVELWATNWIIKLPFPPVWLADLLLASDESKMLEILWHQFDRQNLYCGDEYGEIFLGFYYLRFISNDIQIDEFLHEIIEITDSYQIEDLGPELIHDLFFVEQEPNSIDEVKKVSEKYFSSFGQMSEEGYSYIISCDLPEKEPSFFLDN